MRGPAEALFYVSVGAGMALGTVAFTMVAALLEVVDGPWAIASLVVAALLCSVIALSIGELASMWPSAPAIRTYFKMAFDDRIGLTLVFLYLVFIVLIGGVESYLFALVMRAMLPPLPPLLTVLVLIGGVIIINLYGVDLPRTLQIATTCGAIAIIIGMALVGTAGTEMHRPAATGAGGGLASLPAGVGIAVFLFMGFEWLTTVGLRPGAYHQLIPWSMLIVIAVLLLTYGLFATGLTAVISHAQIVDNPVPQVTFLSITAGQAGKYIAGGLSSLAIVSTFNAGIMGGARLLQAMARERALPLWIATTNLETGAPTGAVLLLGGLAAASSVLVVSLDLYLIMALIGSAIICVIYGAYMLAVIQMRRTRAEHRRPFRTPVPVLLQRIMVVVMPLVGFATLISIPELGVAPVVGFVSSGVVAVTLGEWARRHATLYRLQPTRVVARDRSDHG